jgi:hypothetical protein
MSSQKIFKNCQKRKKINVVVRNFKLGTWRIPVPCKVFSGKMKYIFLSGNFFGGRQCWVLNSGLHACDAGALLLALLF